MLTHLIVNIPQTGQQIRYLPQVPSVDFLPASPGGLPAKHWDHNDKQQRSLPLDLQYSGNISSQQISQ